MTKLLFMTAIDGASSAANMTFSEEAVTLADIDTAYKYLAIIDDDGLLWPLCSKDHKEWEICIGAEKDGEILNLPALIEELTRRAKE